MKKRELTFILASGSTILRASPKGTGEHAAFLEQCRKAAMARKPGFKPEPFKGPILGDNLWKMEGGWK